MLAVTYPVKHSDKYTVLSPAGTYAPYEIRLHQGLVRVRPVESAHLIHIVLKSYWKCPSGQVQMKTRQTGPWAVLLVLATCWAATSAQHYGESRKWILRHKL